MRTDKEIKTLANGPHRDEGLIAETTDRRNVREHKEELFANKFNDFVE